MRNVLFVLSVLSVLSVRCALENPMTDNTDQPRGGAANLPRVTSVYPDSAGMFYEGDSSIAITFSDYLDANTLTSANVKVTNTTTGDEVSSLRLSYDAGARRLYLRNDHWASGYEYLITLVSDGVRNRYGTPLDGNRNRTLEGSPYDDFLWTFHVSGSPARIVGTRPPTIWRIRPDTGRTDTALPLITVDFTIPMDTTTLKESGAPKNLRLIRVSDGSSLPLTIAVFSSLTLGVRPADSLWYGEKYEVVLTSSQIKANDPARTPDFVKTLDADYDGPEASEPDYSWYFVVDTVAPPAISATELISGGLRIEFGRLMDTASLAPANVCVYDRDGYVPGSLYKTVVPYSDPLQTRLEYYFARPTGPDFRLLVSHRVKDAQGLHLDANGNGMGGESGVPPLGDDYEEELP